MQPYYSPLPRVPCDEPSAPHRIVTGAYIACEHSIYEASSSNHLARIFLRGQFSCASPLPWCTLLEPVFHLLIFFLFLLLVLSLEGVRLTGTAKALATDMTFPDQGGNINMEWIYCTLLFVLSNRASNLLHAFFSRLLCMAFKLQNLVAALIVCHPSLHKVSIF